MGFDVCKNDTLPSGNFTDLAGNTATYPYGGESRLGVDFDTGADLATADEVLSKTLVCDICGIPVKNKSDLTRQKGYQVCRNCIDEE